MNWTNWLTGRCCSDDRRPWKPAERNDASATDTVTNTLLKTVQFTDRLAAQIRTVVSAVCWTWSYVSSLSPRDWTDNSARSFSTHANRKSTRFWDIPHQIIPEVFALQVVNSFPRNCPGHGWAVGWCLLWQRRAVFLCWRATDCALSSEDDCSHLRPQHWRFATLSQLRSATSVKLVWIIYRTTICPDLGTINKLLFNWHKTTFFQYQDCQLARI